MYFNSITSGLEFRNFVKQHSEHIVEFILDCGAGVEKADSYRLMYEGEMCNVVGANTSINVIALCDNKKPFHIAGLTSKTPFVEMGFWSFLCESKLKNRLTHYFKEDLMAYLLTLNYVPGEHHIDSSQKRILKSAYEKFHHDLHRGRLHLKQFEYLAIEVVSGSVEAELQSLVVETKAQRVSLPKTKLNHYARIKVLMERAGGKYSKGGFAFPDSSDIPNIMLHLVQGKEYNPKKKYQFFATQEARSLKMVAKVDLKPGEAWFEPSAGDGGIADVASKISPNGTMVELMPENAQKLREKGYSPIEDDFLSLDPMKVGQFPVILGNPPFTNNSDIKHFAHMFDFLEEGGRACVITSCSWETATSKLPTQFREWLKHINAEIEDVPAGEFKDSGTNVATKQITYKKRNMLSFSEFCQSGAVKEAA